MTADTPLPTLVGEVLNWYFDRHPARASSLGSLAHDGTLGEFTASAFETVERESEAWLAKLTAADATTLDDEIDRDLLISVLRGDQLRATWPAWRRDPSVYTSTVLFTLHSALTYALRPEPELVDTVVARLAEVPSILAACQANLDPALASPLIIQRGRDQARTGRAFVTRALPAAIADPELRARLAAAAEPAAEAFDALAAFLDGFTAAGDWRMGEKLYSALLVEQECLGYGAAELHERGKAAYAELDAEMAELAGTSDWLSVMTGLQDDHPPTLEDMRLEYEAETVRARAFLISHGLVTLPEGEECRVVPSPSFHRPVVGVASYMQPPALTNGRVGHFFVPFTPDGYSQEQIVQRLRTNARAQMPTITVHEAYPGHHWHLSWLAAQNRPVRKAFRTPYFSEGWALYAEKLLREHGYFTARAHELAHVEARLFRAARMVVDTALHCGDMSAAEAEAHMVARTALTADTAAAEVSRYCAWPTQAPSYLTGALEIDRIRADYLAAGRGTLREFHDTLAGSGALPLGLARKAVLGG